MSEFEANAAKKPLVAMAGASGFVGSHLRHFLSEHYSFRALTRSAAVASTASKTDTEWRECDLYSLPKVTDALEGCKIGIYLVHSMAPSSRLMQANFEDTDVLLADNFVRAAEAVGIEHIVYLSGLMPEGVEDISPHLRSRREVEDVLRSRSVPVTVLRAGLIFGPGGSSFSMLINLVRRLPVMVLPAWATSKTQAIDIDDICRAFQHVMTAPGYRGNCYDVAGHTVMTYRDLIRETAEHLGMRSRHVNFPLNCFALSRRWVSLFGGVPEELVGPLLESLQYDLSARPNDLLTWLEQTGTRNFQESQDRSVDANGNPKQNPRSETRIADAQAIRTARRVRSVQRMPLPEGMDAQDIAKEYGQWVTENLGGIVQARRDDEGVLRFQLLKRWTLLELTPTPFSKRHPFRCAFYITGGALAREVLPPGRFEFRIFPGIRSVIASIHGFSPTLPWYVYAYTQAIAHLWVMRWFSRHLGGLMHRPSDS